LIFCLPRHSQRWHGNLFGIAETRLLFFATASVENRPNKNAEGHGTPD